MSFSSDYLDECIRTINKLDPTKIDDLAMSIANLREQNGRLFFLGVGGSAANCSHAVNDFRKLCNIECYAPSDNVSELTARTNDEGWHTIYSEWLKISNLNSNDGVFVLSVGGGDSEKNISPNIVEALKLAKTREATIMGITGRDGGYAAKVANHCIIIPIVNPDHVTPHTEAFQGVMWHLLVSHPLLKFNSTKWESATKV